MVFRRRRSGLLVWVGSPLGIVEQQLPNYGRALLDLERGDLIPVNLPWDEAAGELVRLVNQPPPPSSPPLRAGRQRRPA